MDILTRKSASKSTGAKTDHNINNNRSLGESVKFLRRDKARLSNETPIPVPIAKAEQQRRSLVNERYSALKLKTRNSEHNNKIEPFKSQSQHQSLNNSRKHSLAQDDKDVEGKSNLLKAPSVFQLPGFRYHKDGEERKMSPSLLQLKLLSTVRTNSQSVLGDESNLNMTEQSKIKIKKHSAHDRKSIVEGMTASNFRLSNTSTHGLNPEFRTISESDKKLVKGRPSLATSGDVHIREGLSAFSIKHGMTLKLMGERRKLLEEAKVVEQKRSVEALKNLLEFKEAMIKLQSNPPTEIENIDQSAWLDKSWSGDPPIDPNLHLHYNIALAGDYYYV